MKAKVVKKSVKKSVTHDRLTVSATYITGGSFRFTVGRSGERLAWGGSVDAEVARGEMDAFMKLAKFLPGESNGQRINRLHALAESVNSIAELVAKCV